jgi:hypothetical protein
MSKFKFSKNFQFCTSMMLLLTGSLGAVVGAAPAGAFTFSQSGYSISGGGADFRGGPSFRIRESETSRLGGGFEGSDLNGDGKLTCTSSNGNCEITYFSPGVSYLKIYDNLGPTVEGGFGGPYYYSPANDSPSTPFTQSLNLAYTLGDPSSLSFQFRFFDKGNFSSFNGSAVGNSGSFTTSGIPSSATGSSTSPLIVSGDPTPAPEPSTIAGLLLAGGVGTWLKRRSLRRLTARQGLPEKPALNCK